ncbi:MAG TPA: PBP1A family penicillin-binding protein [Stellaceae bacterium]|nr:PBP1A family penicillin-binding protein [Stellaceae bacterium]
MADPPKYTIRLDPADRLRPSARHLPDARLPDARSAAAGQRVEPQAPARSHAASAQPDAGFRDTRSGRSRQPPARPGEAGRGGSRPPPRGWLGFFLKWTATLAVWLLILVGGVVGYVATTLPDTSALTRVDRHPSVTLQAADGSLIATYGDLVGDHLTLKDLPPALPQAVIATEDRRFYSHFGIDPIGLSRAMVTNLRAGQVVQGGSTITQQIAKNVFLTPERTVLRKLQETLLALWLERRFTKDQLLEIYLNRVYLGAGTYGVDAAAQRYFGKSARKLSVYESAIMAGLLKAPTRYSPARDPKRAAARASQVLANMVDAGYLTEAEAATAANGQAPVFAAVPTVRPSQRYFADWVQDQIAAFGGNGDIVVTTTLDPKMQEAAEAAIADTLARDGAKSNAAQAALVAMTPDGAVRAMVGGADYGGSQFNRATQAQRQPGSAFKPFVYLAGLEHGITPQDRFVDGPIHIGSWQPHDFSNKYGGEMTVADAVAESINTIAVQVSEKVGHRRVIEAAQRLGIQAKFDPSDPTIALGTVQVPLIDMTAAYAAFASGGYGAWAYGIEEVKDQTGKVLFKRSGGGPGRVIQPEIVGQMDGLLTGVITRGTGKIAALDRPAAGKTGTTSDYKDALFMGYTSDLVTGVWFGNDDNTPMAKVTGGGLPARAWHDFMMAALQGTPVRPLRLEAAVAAASPPPAASGAGPIADAFLNVLNRARASLDNVKPAAPSTQPHFNDNGGR